MSEPTVTIMTGDHGPVTIPEPAWCMGLGHKDRHAYRADIAHIGELAPVRVDTPDGPRDLLTLSIEQHPFSEHDGDREPHIAVQLLNGIHGYDAAGMVPLAESLTRAGRTLQRTTRRLQAEAGIRPSLFPPRILPWQGLDFLTAIRDHLDVPLYPEGDDQARWAWRDTVEIRVADVLTHLDELLGVRLDDLEVRADSLRAFRHEDGDR